MFTIKVCKLVNIQETPSVTVTASQAQTKFTESSVHRKNWTMWLIERFLKAFKSRTIITLDRLSPLSRFLWRAPRRLSICRDWSVSPVARLRRLRDRFSRTETLSTVRWTATRRSANWAGWMKCSLSDAWSDMIGLDEWLVINWFTSWFTELV